MYYGTQREIILDVKSTKEKSDKELKTEIAKLVYTTKR
jgi:hypothetical protein